MIGDRAVGWYWVIMGTSHSWEVATWDGRSWVVTDNHRHYSDADMREIGPRIPTPDEP